MVAAKDASAPACVVPVALTHLKGIHEGTIGIVLELARADLDGAMERNVLKSKWAVACSTVRKARDMGLRARRWNEREDFSLSLLVLDVKEAVGLDKTFVGYVIDAADGG